MLRNDILICNYFDICFIDMELCYLDVVKLVRLFLYLIVKRYLLLEVKDWSYEEMYEKL